MASISNVIAKQHKFELVDEGELFRNYHKFTIASGGDAEILIKTGAKYPHVLLNSEADGDVNISIYVGTTVSADGTEMNAGNFNFNSAKTTLTTWFHTPTITADGTYVANTDILGGSGVGTPSAAKASASMTGLDVVLIPNTNFMLRFTNNAGRETQVKFEVDYIENYADFS